MHHVHRKWRKICVKNALAISFQYAHTSKSLFRAVKEPSVFLVAQNPHSLTTTPRGPGGSTKGADLTCILETAIKIAKEGYSDIVFGLTTPEGAFLFPRQPADDPLSQEK